MYTGEYNYAIDEKGRIVVPAKFREMLGFSFYITRSLDDCLMLYDAIKWKELEDKVNSLPFTNKGARDLRRFILGSAHQIEIDKQGRILIPQSLREHAQLNDDVVFVGIGSSIEIWNKNKWEKLINQDSNEIASSMEGLGI